MSLSHLDDPENAQQAYRAALAAEPADPAVALNFAVFLQSTGRAGDSQTQLTEYERRAAAARAAGRTLEPEVRRDGRDGR